jgi:hypothetical protein
MSAIVELAGVTAVCAPRRMPGLSAGQSPFWRLRVASGSRCRSGRRTRPRRRRSRVRARRRSREQRLARFLRLLDLNGSCGRAEDSRVAVVPADTQTRRLLGDDLLDDASPRRLSNALALDHDPVSRMRFHGVTSSGPTLQRPRLARSAPARCLANVALPVFASCPRPLRPPQQRPRDPSATPTHLLGARTRRPQREIIDLQQGRLFLAPHRQFEACSERSRVRLAAHPSTKRRAGRGFTDGDLEPRVDPRMR